MEELDRKVRAHYNLPGSEADSAPAGDQKEGDRKAAESDLTLKGGKKA